MALNPSILELAEQTPFVDTHEHLLEESTRCNPAQVGRRAQTLQDFSVLLSHYADADLRVAGMPADALAQLFSSTVDPVDKWTLLAPYYALTRQTGYLLNVRESLRRLFGESDLRADNVLAISEKIRAAIRPGYYAHVLQDVSGIKHCHVNSLETLIFQETEYPELLCQDLGFAPLSNDLAIAPLATLSGIDVGSLADWHRVIDWCFE
ncbi:MAG: hypothetical protein O3A51_14410, partial [Verrucomicrobia bacterium]|nr:hypothetical protein [Verrucomicrobiota bacterium]